MQNRSGYVQYLGDSVYADFDGYAVTIKTDNGYGPTNVIVLEPSVIANLNAYYEWALERTKAQAGQEEKP